METCTELSKALDIARFIATLGKKEKPQTEKQEAGTFPRQIRLRFHSVLANLMQFFFSLLLLCINVQ